MPKQKTPAVPHIKVTRRRRRLYEPLDEEGQGQEVLVTFTKSPQKPADPALLRARAHDIIMDYTMWSAGTGLIPVPIVDVAVIIAIELRMLKKLSVLYKISFSKHRGKALIASLIGGIQVGLFSGSLLKIVPIFGLAGVVVPMCFLAGGLTYAIGKVFVHHFEAGGTLLDFNPEKMQQFFIEQYQQGQQIASEQHQRDRE